jgi:hypothetical protein
MTADDKNKIAAFCVALLAIATQATNQKYFGRVRLLFKVYKAFSDCIKSRNPKFDSIKHINKSVLDILTSYVWSEDWQSLKDASDVEKITVSSAFRILYTFRIGSLFVAQIKVSTCFSRDIMKGLFRSLCPVPLEGEVGKMVKLYTDNTL